MKERRSNVGVKRGKGVLRKGETVKWEENEMGGYEKDEGKVYRRKS